MVPDTPRQFSTAGALDAKGNTRNLKKKKHFKQLRAAQPPPRPQFHRSEAQPHGAGAARYRPWRPQLSCGRRQAPSAALPGPGSSARDAAVTDTTAEPSGAAGVRRESDGSGWAMPPGPVPRAVSALLPTAHRDPSTPISLPSVPGSATEHRGATPAARGSPHPLPVPGLAVHPGLSSHSPLGLPASHRAPRAPRRTPPPLSASC